ncbi:MAG: ATP-binding protein [Coriobacteriia bacterium]|nr:ATP-binding protein [Coriobacteriia bacterium]
MKPDAIADLVALLAFAVATYFALRVPIQAPAVGRLVKYSTLAVAAMYALVSVSNLLEHAGVTAFFDVYEDFAEVLYVPLVASAIYSRLGAERLVAARRAEEAIRSEHELLTSIVETTPTGILVVDADGVVYFANELAERMLERVVPGQLDLGAIVRSGGLPRHREPVGSGEDIVYVAVRCTLLSAGAAGPERAVVVLEDVTDRVRNDVQAEEYRQGLERAIDLRTGELLEVNRRLQYASDAKQQFLTKMSHELRTPLNAIIGFSEIMLKGLSGPLTDEQATQLGMVRNSGQHLLEMVNDVLDISRLEAGYSPVSVSTVDVGAHMRDLVASMGAIAAIHQVALVCDCSGAQVAATDAEKLDQIVRNLISNAVKFTDPGGRVTVTVAPDKDYVAISVADTGIGIAEEHHERIFEAFQQVETPNRTRPQGTGLGLVICRELCGVLGCVLTVESAPQKGSVFTVTLPRQYPGHLVIL